MYFDYLTQFYFKNMKTLFVKFNLLLALMAFCIVNSVSAQDIFVNPYQPQTPNTGIYNGPVVETFTPTVTLANCVEFQPHLLYISTPHPNGPSFVEEAGSHKVIDQFQSVEDASRAIDVIRHYGFTSRCNMNYGNHNQNDQGAAFYLKNGKAAQKSLANENIYAFNPNQLTTRHNQTVNGTKKWRVYDKGRMSDLYIFDTKAEAESMIYLIKSYGFTKRAISENQYGTAIYRSGDFKLFNYLLK